MSEREQVQMKCKTRGCTRGGPGVLREGYCQEHYQASRLPAPVSQPVAAQEVADTYNPYELCPVCGKQRMEHQTGYFCEPKPSPQAEPSEGAEEEKICWACSFPDHDGPCQSPMSAELQEQHRKWMKRYELYLKLPSTKSYISWDRFLLQCLVCAHDSLDHGDNLPTASQPSTLPQSSLQAQIMDAINWLMGCGDSDFIKPEGAPTYWFRSEFKKRAGLEYDGEKYVVPSDRQRFGKKEQ